MEKIKKSEAEWKKKLSKEQYKILREKSTEIPGTGKLLHNKENGDYNCAACGNLLFKSEDKFDSRTGWPSFTKPATENSLEYNEDNELGIKRIEVVCQKCGSHLGHVFDDGPKEKGGKRFCINSVSCDFKKH